MRKTETSFTNKRRFLVVWPDAAADHIDIVSTLFQNYENKDFEDKVDGSTSFIIFILLILGMDDDRRRRFV